MENKEFTVSVHVEGLTEKAAVKLFSRFMKVADRMGVSRCFTGAVYETQSDEEQIETLKRLSEIASDEDNA